MGFLDTIKGWFNIGGVKVKLIEAPKEVSRSQNTINGKFEMTSKSDKEVLKVTYRLIEEHTKKKGDDKVTETDILGEHVVTEGFEIKTGETKVMDFTINYAIPERMRDTGGMLGAAAKFGAFAGGEKLEYYIQAICDVKGTAFDPEAKQPVKIIA